MHRLLVSCLVAGLALPPGARSQSGDVQIDQVRQFSSPLRPTLPGPTGLEEPPPDDPGAAPDDAFGAQVMLKHQERFQPFSGFAEASAFFTNNVALARLGSERECRRAVHQSRSAFHDGGSGNVGSDRDFRGGPFPRIDGRRRHGHTRRCYSSDPLESRQRNRFERQSHLRHREQRSTVDRQYRLWFQQR